MMQHDAACPLGGLLPGHVALSRVRGAQQVRDPRHLRLGRVLLRDVVFMTSTLDVVVRSVRAERLHAAHAHAHAHTSRGARVGVDVVLYFYNRASFVILATFVIRTSPTLRTHTPSLPPFFKTGVMAQTR